MCTSKIMDVLNTLECNVLQDMFLFSGDGITISDKDQRIIIANKSYLDMTGYELDDVLQIHPVTIACDSHDDTFYENMHETLHTVGVWQGDVWTTKKDGTTLPTTETISVIRNPSGDVTHYVSIIRDTTELKRMEETLKDLAFRDSLTNLYNRRYFVEYMETQISHLVRTKQSFALVMIDLDDFSKVNNTYGHAVGDELLMSVARRLNGIFSRKSDVIARMGGDEFVAIISDIGHTTDEIYKTCELIAKRVNNSLVQPHKSTNTSVKISASIGVAYVDNKCKDVKEIMKQADDAMYKGKKAGKNTFKIYPVIGGNR